MSGEQEPVYDLESVSKLIKGKEGNDEADEIIVEEGLESDSDNDVVVEEDEQKTDEASDTDDEGDLVDVVVEEKPKKKKGFKRDKRIEGLIKKNTKKDSEIEELKKQIEVLMQKDAERTHKENEVTLSELEVKKREAFESSDYDEYKKYEQEMSKIQSSNQDMSPQEIADYFKQKNPWYQVDEARSNVAENIHSKMINDPAYQHMSIKQQLDLVSQRVNDMPQFKQNPYQSSSPSEGAPLQRPSKKVTRISRAELESVRMMFPELDEKALRLRAKELVEAVNKNQEQ
tara:strand:+ start:765 stop:1625 length:861 start_codon:yes stop_codon:yes gene_type:complete